TTSDSTFARTAQPEFPASQHPATCVADIQDSDRKAQSLYLVADLIENDSNMIPKRFQQAYRHALHVWVCIRRGSQVEKMSPLTKIHGGIDFCLKGIGQDSPSF